MMIMNNNYLINKMFFISKIFFCLCILLLITQTVSAHPPSNMDINFDIENQELKVNITHSVTTDTHYIKLIEIQLNGEKYNSYNYNSQPAEMSFSYNYNINATKEDIFKVIAECNQFGTLTRELTVGGENDSSSTPGFITILIIFSILIIVVFFKKGIKY